MSLLSVEIMPTHPKNLPEGLLRKLYLNRSLSAYDIAKRLDCCHTTILSYLRKYGIPRRSRLGNRRPITISKRELKELYCNQKLSQKVISQKLGHSSYGIQRRMRLYGIKTRSYSEANTRHPKFDFSNDQKEKSYLIGFRLGDLNVYKIHNLIQARCSTTIVAQTNLVGKLFGKYTKVSVQKAKRGTFEIRALLNKSFAFLLKKEDRIPRWTQRVRAHFLSFLAGYADAEGSYYLRRPRPKVGKTGWAAFEIQTYDRNILLTIHQRLVLLGIDNTFSKSRSGGYVDKRGVTTNKNCWRVTIARKQSLWNFIKLIERYHRHEIKLKDLRRVKENLIWRNSQPRCHKITL